MFVLKTKYIEVVSLLKNDIRSFTRKIADSQDNINRLISLSQDHFFAGENSILLFCKDKSDALFFCRYWNKDNDITIRVTG